MKNKIENDPKFKASAFFLMKNLKRLQKIYELKKDDQTYIDNFNNSIQKCKTKQEAQEFIDIHYQEAVGDIKSLETIISEAENEHTK